MSPAACRTPGPESGRRLPRSSNSLGARTSSRCSCPVLSNTQRALPIVARVELHPRRLTEVPWFSVALSTTLFLPDKQLDDARMTHTPFTRPAGGTYPQRQPRMSRSWGLPSLPTPEISSSYYCHIRYRRLHESTACFAPGSRSGQERQGPNGKRCQQQTHSPSRRAGYMQHPSRPTSLTGRSAARLLHWMQVKDRVCTPKADCAGASAAMGRGKRPFNRAVRSIEVLVVGHVQRMSRADERDDGKAQSRITKL
ncbi:hypothetical protein F4780DRAFT_595202 [Xylariomycetidae sp. FL0641]|nr:hypothetical protein F4780DRAFT_595202 [Xylariomycetidae sp. FL0641]